MCSPFYMVLGCLELFNSTAVVVMGELGNESASDLDEWTNQEEEQEDQPASSAHSRSSHAHSNSNRQTSPTPVTI